MKEIEYQEIRMLPLTRNSLFLAFGSLMGFLLVLFCLQRRHKGIQHKMMPWAVPQSPFVLFCRDAHVVEQSTTTSKNWCMQPILKAQILHKKIIVKGNMY